MIYLAASTAPRRPTCRNRCYAACSPGIEYIHAELAVPVQCDEWVRGLIKDANTTGEFGRAAQKKCARLSGGGQQPHEHLLSITAIEKYGPVLYIDRAYLPSDDGRSYTILEADMHPTSYDILVDKILRSMTSSVVVPRLLNWSSPLPSSSPVLRAYYESLPEDPARYNFARGIVVSHIPCFAACWQMVCRFAPLGVRYRRTVDEMADEVLATRSFYCSELIMALLLCVPEFHAKFPDHQISGVPEPFSATPDDCAYIFSHYCKGVQITPASLQGVRDARDVKRLQDRQAERTRRREARERTTGPFNGIVAQQTDDNEEDG